MKLFLERRVFNDNNTIGFLFCDGKMLCYVLEDKCREIPGHPVEEWKVPNKTAIPQGVYDIDITWSPRFKRFLPMLKGVPGFAGVRIHTGNTEDDTEGCLIVGAKTDYKRVLESRYIFPSVMNTIKKALDAGEDVTIEVKGLPNA